MKSLVASVLAIALVLAAGLCYGKDYEVSKKAGDFDVTVRMDKNPPVSGENNVEIAVKDPSGKNVTDAKVVFQYSMPAMPGMPAMSYKTDAELKGSIYRARINYSMSGSWTNEVKISRGSKTASAKFTVDAR